MFLKKIYNLIILNLLFILIFLSFEVNSIENQKRNNAINYLKNLNEFSSKFLQIQNNDVSEGLIYIKNKRLRIEYTSPNNLIFILKENKGMYFNVDLKEVQYFNPKNTIGKFLIDLFYNNQFLSNSKIVSGPGFFYIYKNIMIDDVIYKVKIFFEEKPFQLKKLEIINEYEILAFTIVNPNFNPEINDKIFSLANPLLS